MTPAERLTVRLDDLASSLHRAGIADGAAARLLELAALATLKAVELELRTAHRNDAPLRAAPPPLDALPASLRVAA
jgi:hypothetical protein